MEKALPAYNSSWRHILFGFEGRCNRRDYCFKYCLPLILFIVAVITYKINAPRPEVPIHETPIGKVVLLFLQLLTTWMFIAVGKKRCQDMEKSPGFLVYSVVPIFNIYCLCVLAFKSGTPGPNKYGLPYGKTSTE
ncbi:DUF805 domain-containing protein [uncultured Pseudodesulfovibrio sp.]|uniref:DUF805 domain-containing protein n=1 Tax=uncultured Pseudodesulfovibrio sp. TaxID=2035858 RepID=UPI0029C7FE57|nr:DUF805 domain-containing protein [uncultured Pseudodesulfovibrio sp.]